MITLKYKWSYTILLLILFSQPVYGWWGWSTPWSNDHYELTDQALDAVDNNDTLNKYQELYDDYKDKIKYGAKILRWRLRDED